MTKKDTKRAAAGDAAEASRGEDGAAERTAAGPAPFRNALDYLDEWFGVVEPPAPDAGDRVGLLHHLLARTEASLAAGRTLPLEEYVRGNGLDLLDRLLLLALLRAAHEPEGDGGVAQARLLGSFGAETLSNRRPVLARLETAGKLRDLGAVHCFTSPNRSQRQYRLAPWLVEPLTTGAGSLEGLPELAADPIEELEHLRGDVIRVVEALAMDATAPILLWQAPAEGRPGWDHLALRRWKLDRRLEAAARSESSPVGAEIRRLGLEGIERIAWAFLLHDAQESPLGVTMPLLVRFAGRAPDPEAAARKLVGPGSRLAAHGCVRFSRADGPYLAKVVWLSREASLRVFPWSRDAFVVRPGKDGEPTATVPRRFGFDVTGAAKEDRAAAEAGRGTR